MVWAIERRGKSISKNKEEGKIEEKKKGRKKEKYWRGRKIEEGEKLKSERGRKIEGGRNLRERERESGKKVILSVNLRKQEDNECLERKNEKETLSLRALTP